MADFLPVEIMQKPAVVFGIVIDGGYQIFEFKEGMNVQILAAIGFDLAEDFLQTSFRWSSV